MRIKVCGITRAADLQGLIDNGVDYAGFIFYEKSPRFAGSKIDARTVRETTGIKKVGVFVNAPQDQVLRTVADYALDMVQLHGDETPEYCAAVRTVVPVIKAFRIGDNVNWETELSPYLSVTDYFLFDTASVKGYGGTGERFNWELLEQYPFTHPFLLSGGIAPDQATVIRSLSWPALLAVDVNSKFEDSPGIKNIPLVTAFVQALQQEKLV
ncbi:phosphoribosylanthranilate isomerase [Chitinophaga nivalis]|uniref:N-(5'-phosphoribosyl)anthranilate isomerase n=1 Tax=Chitinophaga nivalis TaxID=2991709 RepID=A0ABT3IFJ5_9BACT|nr:phosphoribosylanthranilate isomerase [Chitinophaga nivalis]MCW3467573.1 phosphoribosylanthranilate isomerase [Chitinophaga nivalis]MCW3482735.1 phosphoribosylanthranilate isomerase [Chitinophaga nivalis]